MKLRSLSTLKTGYQDHQMISKLVDVLMLANGIIYFLTPQTGKVPVPESLQSLLGTASVSLPGWWGFLIGATAALGLLSILRWDAVSDFLDDVLPARHAFIMVAAILPLAGMKFGLINPELALPLNVALFGYGVAGFLGRTR